MAQGTISKKYLIDIANAIRIMLDTQSTYTPSQMASAIATITGNTSGGSLVKSSNTDIGLITDTLMDGICDALRTALDSSDEYTPSQIADAIMTISTSPAVEIVPWSTGTDEQIVAMLQAAHNGDIDLQTDGGWHTGDVRTITVGSWTDGAGNSHASQDLRVVITSFREYMSCGNVMQFDFVDSDMPFTRMNPTNTNAGGYDSTEIYTSTIPALVNALPTWLKNALIEFSVLASSGSQSNTIETISGNKLALRSEIEVFGSTTFSYSGEGSQIPYYAASANRKKYQNAGGGVYICNWLLRSPTYKDTMTFCHCASTSANYMSASTVQGLAPFGCL